VGEVVKRFRTLGQIQKKVKPESLVVESAEVKPVVPVLVSDSKERQVRSDKKHQYPLRLVHPFWRRITALNLNCRGMDSGPSLNETLCDLLLSSLDDVEIVNRIMSKYPDRDQLVIVRSWERG